MSEDHVWTEQFAVRVFETDAHGTLAVRSLCDYMQEAAGNHAHSYGVGVGHLIDKGMTWVLSRLRVKVERLPGNGERLTIVTWPSGIDRLFALRDFLVTDEAGAPIAAAVTGWLILDTQSKRPVRPQTQAVPGGAARPRALENGFEKLPTFEAPEAEQEITVRWSDLDVNMHVNNSRYAEWAVEGAAGLGGGMPGTLARLDIDFLSETQHPGAVIVQSRRLGGNPSAMAHLVLRAGDRAETARVRTEWRPR
jgi:medium-chain acyl-[acyl-carrier-protein] hydrolase